PEVRAAIDVFYDGDAFEGTEKMTERVRNYVKSKEPEWKVKYFGEKPKENLANDSENLSSNEYYIEPHKTYIQSAENLNLSKFPKLNKYGCALQSGLQGSSLDWSDEMVGAGYAAQNMMNNAIHGINPVPYIGYDYSRYRDNHRDYLEACMQQYPNLSKSSYAHGQALTQTLLAAQSPIYAAMSMPIANIGKSKGEFISQIKNIANDTGSDITKDVLKNYLGLSINPYIDTFVDTYFDK
ncbi:MAG: hypothetical protein IJ019_04425, partial [Alphaproteobacteria bacterium]|nr:hypothetical protein [Alphaproteobacteria bacterium]